VHYKIPLVLTAHRKCGFTVTSPRLPELVTQGDTAEEALGNVQDALVAVVEIYKELDDRCLWKHKSLISIFRYRSKLL